jgi:hypothetical protein
MFCKAAIVTDGKKKMIELFIKKKEKEKENGRTWYSYMIEVYICQCI